MPRPGRRRIAKHQCRTGRRVDFFVVMHFEDLDVEFLIQRLATRRTSAARRLTPKLMLPDLTITARLAACAIRFSFSPVEPGGADDMDHSPFPCRELGESQGRGGNREIEKPVSARSSSGSTSAGNLQRHCCRARQARRRRGRSPQTRLLPPLPPASRPCIAAMAWMSVRPMRPPAPATISRMSDMVLSRSVERV